MDHKLEYNGTMLVEYVKSNPLQSLQKRVQATLQSWLAAYANATSANTPSAIPPRRPRRSELATDDREDDGEEAVVTVTKIQFLEQQLAELRAMMAAPPAPAPAAPPSAVHPTEASGGHVALRAVETALPTPRTPGAGSPASDPEPARPSPAAPAFQSPPGRPNMVALVAQATSAVKLK